MASNNDDPNKPVTGYPSPAGQVATGYPRSAPPIDNAYFYSRPPPLRFFARHYHPCRHDRSSIVFRITSAMLSAILLMSLVLFIIWLVLRPRLPEFRLSSAVASPLNTTTSELTLTFDLSFQIKNPNTKLNVVYDRLEASVFYMDDFLLTETGLTPFYQARGNQTLIRARLAAVGANVGHDVVMTIREEQQSGSLSFGIRVLALVRFQCRGWRTRKHLLRVFCYGVKMGYSSSGGPGSLLNPLKECLVEL